MEQAQFGMGQSDQVWQSKVFENSSAQFVRSSCSSNLRNQRGDFRRTYSNTITAAGFLTGFGLDSQVHRFGTLFALSPPHPEHDGTDRASARSNQRCNLPLFVLE